MVDGDAMDTLWWNIVEHPSTGAWSAVDREWRFRGDLPVDYVVWRNLSHFHQRFTVDLPEPFRATGPESFASAILEQAGLLADGTRVALFAELERSFTAAAKPGPLPTISPAVEALMGAPALPRFQVLAMADEVIAQPGLLRAYAVAFDAADPSTLVLRSSLDTDIVRPLRAAIVAAGLDEATMPDTVLVGAEESVVAAAMLTGHPAWAPEGVPCFSQAEVTDLRALAERHWAAAD